MKLTRREFCQGTAILTLALAGTTGLSLSGLGGSALAQTPTPEELAEPGPDGDVVLGDEKAPVTIIEYASMTCGHCAHFSVTTFPELKTRYIDTGKVRFIMREFPLDPLAAAGFMLARCAGKDKYMPMVETLFAKQADWVVQKPLDPLKEIAKQAGFTEESFEAVPGESEDTRQHPGGARPRLAEARRQLDTDLFRQRQEDQRRPADRGIRQGDRPLSQERIRVFSRCRGRLRTPVGAIYRMPANSISG